MTKVSLLIQPPQFYMPWQAGQSRVQGVAGGIEGAAL